MISKWGVSIPLLSDELFSSWLVRVALTLGCDPLALSSTLWPGWRIWTQDADRGLSEDRLSRLAEVSNIPLEDLTASSLRPTVMSMTSVPPDDLAVWP